MKILITGSSGFIGTNLIAGCPHDVVPLDIRGGLDVVTFDADMYVDVVVHLAAVSSIQECEADPIKATRTNVLGTLNMLEWSKVHAKKFILASSAAVDGDHNHYAVDKGSAEEYTLLYRKFLDTTILRFYNVYGDAPSKGVVAKFMSSGRTKTPIVVNGDGSNIRDFVWVGDIVDAVLTEIEVTGSNFYNVGTGVGTSILTLANIMAEAYNVPVFHGPGLDETWISVCPNGTAKTTLKDGLSMLIGAV